MTDTNTGIVKYIPGLILCIILGWLALQWDQSIHRWQKDYQASEKILKVHTEEGKPFLPFMEYVAKNEEKYQEKLAAFERGEAKEKRDAVKAEKRERKAALQKSVSESLRGPESAVRAGEAQRARSEPDAPTTYCPFHRPKWCEPNCKHRVAK